MSVVDPCKWTCPLCDRTVAVYAAEPDQRAALTVIQQRHSKAHAEAIAGLARLGFPDPVKRQKGRAA